MFRTVAILLLPVIGSAMLQSAAPHDDVEPTLTRAESLYFEARFKDSVDLLLPLDATLREQPGRARESIRVKLQLALGYIGQNMFAQAKSVFQEVCALDAAYALDSTQFAPKVLTLFDEARTENRKARCEAWCAEIDESAKAADVLRLLRLAREIPEGCACPATAAAAELLYTQGVEAYRKDELGEAIERLRAALKLQPKHELAKEYAALADSKVKVSVDQKLLDWRKNIDAQEFAKAASVYRQLESMNIEGKGDAALEQMRAEYGRIATSRLDSWNRVCASGGSLSLETVRQQVAEIFPGEGFAAGAISRFTPCEAKVAVPPAPVEKVEPVAAAIPGPTTCLDVSSQLAMARIKSQVSPDIPFGRLPREPLNLRVKVKIDENGNVAVNDIAGAPADIREAMRVAVEKWKFSPAIVEDRRRCVETELPVLLHRAN